MAVDSAKGTSSSAAGNTVGNSAGAVGRMRGTRREQPKLNEKQLFVRQTARNAIKAAKLVIKRIERGDDVSGDAIEACTQLAGKTAILLIGD